jgi:hypothetical protein
VSLMAKCRQISSSVRDSTATSTTTSPLGELDGVARQVDDELAQTSRISYYRVWHIRRDMTGQFQTLLRARTASVFIVSSRLSRKLKSMGSRSSLPASIWRSRGCR